MLLCISYWQWSKYETMQHRTDHHDFNMIMPLDSDNNSFHSYPNIRLTRWLQAAYMAKMQKRRSSSFIVRIFKEVLFRAFVIRRHRKKISQFLGYYRIIDPISPLDKEVLLQVMKHNAYSGYITFLRKSKVVTVADMFNLMRKISVEDKHEELMSMINTKAYVKRRKSTIKGVKK
jgi:hypothetical protein